MACLIPHFKRRRILRFRFAMIIDACRADIGVPEPLLDFRNIRAGVERIRRGCCTRGVRAEAIDADADGFSIVFDHPVHARGL